MLSTCSLVCTGWLQHARLRMFSRIFISLHNAHRFGSLLAASWSTTSFAPHVRAIELDDKVADDFWTSEVLPKYVARFSRLTTSGALPKSLPSAFDVATHLEVDYGPTSFSHRLEDIIASLPRLETLKVRYEKRPSYYPVIDFGIQYIRVLLDILSHIDTSLMISVSLDFIIPCIAQLDWAVLMPFEWDVLDATLSRLPALRGPVIIPQEVVAGVRTNFRDWRIGSCANSDKFGPRATGVVVGVRTQGLWPEGSDNEGLDALKLPDYIFSTLPPTSLPITQLLEWDLPPQTDVVVDGDLQPSQYFSSEEPCGDIEDLFKFALAVPPRRLVNNLNAAAGQAVIEGKMSVCTPGNPQVKLPLRVLTYWTYLLDASDAQKTWKAVMRVKDADDLDMKLTVHGVLATLPWHGHLKGFGIRVGDLAQLLSNQYLEAKIIDALIAVLTLRLCRVGGTLGENTLLLDSTFGSFLEMLHPIVNGIAEGPIKESKGGRKYLEKHREWLRSRPDGQLYSVVYRPEEHWTVCKVVARERHTQYGDGLQWKRPQEFFESLGLWLRDQNGAEFSTTDDLPCARQTDGVNCGIIAINAIAHNVFGDPLWTTKSAKALRMKAFCDIVKDDTWMKVLHPCAEVLSHADSIPQRSSPSIDSSDLDLADGAQNVMAAGFAIDEEHLRVCMASDDVHPEIPSQIPAPDPAAEHDSDVEMWKLNPAETSSLKRRAEEPLEEQENRCGKAAKTRSVTIVTPAIFLRKAISIPLPNSVDPKAKKNASASASGKKAKPAPAITESSSAVIGISHAATKARELRNEVKSGAFQASDTKTANFRRKITSEWDSNAEFEETCKRVRCSMCSGWVEMKEPYNIARFKDHCNKRMQGCTRAAPPEPVKKPKTTLDRFLTAAPPAKPVNKKLKVSKVLKTVNRPCPGLSAAYNPQCGVYLERSGAAGGGARAFGKYVKDIFGDKKTAELTKTEKELAYAAQHHDQTWRNDYAPGIMASFAVGTNACLKTVQVDPHSSALPQPCTSCLLLFTSKSYQAVINKPLPENGNFKFTPKRSQNEHLGMQFARYKGLEQLFAEVAIRFSPKYFGC
ncbi:hypothetical protein GGX14DRAFT_394042 [Mycena pura]|uniref:Ubiquitin-like protease family profile domain-containing protein n=1 Tax=Mycena pura TaxID=153505 RepID=A0AAD6YI86_9AGAR|nr:hypothetical protein GGX14DRAFT_394042 [Mycena pura]